MLIFSTIYQLEEENITVDYPLLASKTTLSESSVRDYTQKLIKNLRVGLLKEGKELESYLAESGQAAFEQIKPGKYDLEISGQEKKVASISLDIKI